MPRNRQQIPRAEREAAMVEHAWELFAAKGYKATSVAEVGRAAGVAANAVRWYFPTKDDLFAAAIDRFLAQVRARVEADPGVGGDPQRELVALLADMEPYRGLHREAYERIVESKALGETYARMQEWLEERLLASIATRLPEGADVGLVADTAHVLFEGLLVSVRRSDRETCELVELLTEALVAAAAARAVS
ncbi:TetR/AcrR family transcriptional regulator [Streptomyces sp. BE147]|uniref:TetR/AcrR family transcriptional regulator n=1 Tax=Streptomyces sp. BE147 TaxID=3002524 RepID=UPI002E7A5236|nr:TetR/AcrR family transcriptional regulator [Streptomyces sp. BE147]MEE1740256.1 TetR/AcrR family transcriptional regulator [Streptomyces sp. BE147]